jgi:peptide/nickel transport system ATP-binding protein
VSDVASTGDGPLLSVADLSVGFDGFDGYADVVKNINITVERSEVVTIVGETGCGKSVTSKAIASLLDEPPANISGEVEFEGRDLRSLSESERDELKGDRFSMVFQNPLSSLNPVFTVGKQLTDTAQFGGGQPAGPLAYLKRRFTGSDREEARERVVELLREVQLPDAEAIMDSYPSELSGGMAQRVLIAQALINEPDLLIADELGSALDVTVHDQILSLLEDIIEERNMSVLMITHNLGVAREISDRIYIMYGGQIVETAPTETVFSSPRHPYTQGLIASIPRLSGESTAGGIEGSVPEYTDPPQGCRFHPRCPYAHEACTEGEVTSVSSGPDSHVSCELYTDGNSEPMLAETKRKFSQQAEISAQPGGMTEESG